jgi:hypothetical protein
VIREAPLKPNWGPIWLACKCGQKWDDWQPQQVPIDTWVAHIKTFRCPKCGNRGHNILLRRFPLEDEA